MFEAIVAAIMLLISGGARLTSDQELRLRNAEMTQNEREAQIIYDEVVVEYSK